jgi:hypothetical protein
MSFEEPPWLWSESTWPLSSAFLHHVLLVDLTFKQSVVLHCLETWPVPDGALTEEITDCTIANAWMFTRLRPTLIKDEKLGEYCVAD